MKTVDVIIPTYKPGKKLRSIINRLSKQTYKINRIILINTERKYFIDEFATDDYFDKYGNVTVIHISKDEFDHAATRSLGVKQSDADIFVMMTDDALPYNKRLISNLVEPIIEGKAQAVYGRQCVSKDAGPIERYTRQFNYPLQSMYKTVDDKERLGIKTYFFSDVCAAYDRATFDKLGGYVDRAIFNEDMIYASKLIESGYAIYYSADAKVEHYHRYTNMQQLRRNFDLGTSQAMHPEVFADLASTNEGIKLVIGTAKYLAAKGKIFMIPGMMLTSAFKYLGFFLGKRYDKIPTKIRNSITMNKTFWANR